MADFIFNIDNQCTYPLAPFNPNTDYPEFHGLFNQFDPSNSLYKNIRNLFISAGFDKNNIGSELWNPFRGKISEGQMVVLKPNLVFEETGRLLGTKCLTTNAAILRPLIDYLLLLKRTDRIEFKIIIADVPIQGADFNKIKEQTGLRELCEFYKNYYEDIKLLDLRHKIAISDNTGFYNITNAEGDPMGYSKIHLENSFLGEIANEYKKFGAPGYGLHETYSQIDETGYHYYHIPNTILNCDLFINLPKLKTHKKAGITIAMKNLIGINGEKAWIPHFRRGSIRNGGDEFDNNQVFLKTLTSRASIMLQGKSKLLWISAKFINKNIFKRFFRKDYKNINGIEQKSKFLLDGNWFGNDTLWRSILDLNYLLFHIDKKCTPSTKQIRKYICITDGIISGEGDGPLEPTPKKSGIISLSENPIYNDICLSKIMGFSWNLIPHLKYSIQLHDNFGFRGNVNNIKILQSNKINDTKEILFDMLPNLNFIAPPGWIKHI